MQSPFRFLDPLFLSFLPQMEVHPAASFGSKHFSQLPLMEYMGYSFHVLVLSIETRDMLHVKV